MTVFGIDPVADQLDEVLTALDEGRLPAERRQVDFKEEAGRRGRGGEILPGEDQSDAAATALAPEVACMANTPGGGALILGVADDGTVIGTALNEDWLQVRLYQLLQQAYTTSIHPVMICGVRVLVVRCPPAVEPIRWKNRITWRVGDQCQDIDSASWHERRAFSWGFDWSAQSSGVAVDRAQPVAIQIARDFLEAAGDARSEELAQAPQVDLLRRLGAVHDDGTFTNAGALLFVGRATPALDYMRRPAAGADTQERVNIEGRSLLEELAAVFTAARSYNPEIHLMKGLVIGRTRAVPERALREAIVNGLAHREWIDTRPTTVEHIGRTVRVTSPGGFFGGVRPENIINHPPVSRNKDLSQLLATLRIAERQGVGVDRMFGDMIRAGHPTPVIDEVDGVMVRTVLAAERADEGWIRWLGDITPDIRSDLRALMALHRLCQKRWTDPEDLAPVLQLTVEEARQTVQQLAVLELAGERVCHEIEGLPVQAPRPGVALNAEAYGGLVELRQERGALVSEPSRDEIAVDYAQQKGRISTTELGSILGVHPTNLGRVLRSLESQGLLTPSRSNRRGAGFFYHWAG